MAKIAKNVVTIELLFYCKMFAKLHSRQMKAQKQ